MIAWTPQNSTGFTLSELTLINAVKTDLAASGHLDGHADMLLENALQGRHHPTRQVEVRRLRRDVGL